jgi:hypothetical protein
MEVHRAPRLEIEKMRSAVMLISHEGFRTEFLKQIDAIETAMGDYREQIKLLLAELPTQLASCGRPLDAVNAHFVNKLYADNFLDAHLEQSTTPAVDPNKQRPVGSASSSSLYFQHHPSFASTSNSNPSLWTSMSSSSSSLTSYASLASSSSSSSSASWTSLTPSSGVSSSSSSSSSNRKRFEPPNEEPARIEPLEVQVFAPRGDTNPASTLTGTNNGFPSEEKKRRTT